MHRRPATSYSIATFGEYDSVAAIRAVLRQLKVGQFHQAAAMVDNMAEDDRIDAVLRTRVGALMGTELDIKPVDERRKAIMAAELLGGVEDGPGEWDRMFPPGVVSELLRFGSMLNFGLAEILWTSERGMWWPRLKLWDPQFVHWDEMAGTYRLRTVQGDIDLPRLDQNPVGDGRWFVWNPFGYQYAWRRGMVRSLASMYMMRQWDKRDWARYCEAHGLPLRKAVVPGGGGDENAHQQFFDQVANMGNEPTVMVPQGVEGDRYDVELVEATSLSGKTFGEFKSALDIDIAVMLLGQNLTTEATGGGLGDGGAGIHSQVKREKLREDAAIAVAFRDQVLVPWAQFNFGDPDLAPRPVYRIDPPEDGVHRAAELEGIGKAISALKAAGAPINLRTICQDAGVPMLTEEEQAQLEADEAAKAQEQAPLDPNDGNPPGGGDPKNPKEPDEKPAAFAAKKARRLFVASDVVERYDFAGLPVAVEHKAGTTREYDSGASVQMTHDYGFIEGHLGKDGDELDCYIGPNESASDVFVVHQLKAPNFTALDEDKVMIGFNTEDEARQSYLAHRGPDGERAIGSIDTIPLDEFKAKLARRTAGGIIKASAMRARRIELIDKRARQNARASGRLVAVRRSPV